MKKTKKDNPVYTNEEYLDLHGAPDGAYPKTNIQNSDKIQVGIVEPINAYMVLSYPDTFKGKLFVGNRLIYDGDHTTIKQKELLMAAFKAGGEFDAECHCGECDYYLQVKGDRDADFESWYKTNVIGE